MTQLAGYPLHTDECLHQKGTPCMDCGICFGGWGFGHPFIMDKGGPGQSDRCATCFRPVVKQGEQA